jgi:hypothetical protein
LDNQFVWAFSRCVENDSERLHPNNLFTMDLFFMGMFFGVYAGGDGYNRWAGAPEKSQAATRRGELVV